MAAEVGLAAAFIGGLVSFASPCVLPLIPAYLSFMTGLTGARLSEDRSARGIVLVPSLLFVAGFSVVFIALGASASILGQLLAEYRPVLEKAGGIAIVAFGLLMLGIIKIPALYREMRVDPARARAWGGGAGFVMGIAFAAGWTPCLGPVLGAILTLAGSTAEVGQGALLLALYSAGLGLPFLLVAVLFDRLADKVGRLARRAEMINRVAGVVLIALGLLVFTGRLSVLGAWLNRVL